MNNDHNKIADSSNECDANSFSFLQSLNKADFEFLKGLTDAVLDALLDNATPEGSQDKQENDRLISAILDEFERRNLEGFVMREKNPDISIFETSNGEGEFDFLRGLSEDELDDLLDTAASEITLDESQNNEENVRLIDAILDELERRNPDGYGMSDEELQRAYERFCERARAEGIIIDREKKPSGKRKYRSIAAIAASVFIIFFIGVGLSTTADADQYTVWNKIVDWSKDTFNWGEDEQAISMKEALENSSKKMNPKIASLNAALKDNGLQVKLPTWIPDRYLPTETKVDAEGSSKVVVGWYENNGAYFSITVSGLPDEKPSIRSSAEENAGEGSIYKAGGFNYYITSNENRYSAVSEQGNVWIKIQGELSYDEIIYMIDSIYERK